jgi:lipoate-protein ligase A
VKLLEKTYPSPQENLACEEAILLNLEEHGEDEVLRIWETLPNDNKNPFFVVLGHANRVNEEVNTDACHHHKIEILRRCSGGGTVLNGPGCMSYCLYLRMDLHPELISIQNTNQFILNKMKSAIDPFLQDSHVKIKGTSDMTINNKKFSGNAQSRKRRYILFHGTIMHNFDFSLLNKILKSPPKQPDYRQNRQHSDFVMNLQIPSTQLIDSIKKIWSADTPYQTIPEAQIQELAQTKYTTNNWNFKF